MKYYFYKALIDINMERKIEISGVVEYANPLDAFDGIAKYIKKKIKETDETANQENFSITYFKRIT